MMEKVSRLQCCIKLQRDHISLFTFLLFILCMEFTGFGTRVLEDLSLAFSVHNPDLTSGNLFCFECLNFKYELSCFRLMMYKRFSFGLCIQSVLTFVKTTVDTTKVYYFLAKREPIFPIEKAIATSSLLLYSLFLIPLI